MWTTEAERERERGRMGLSLFMRAMATACNGFRAAAISLDVHMFACKIVCRKRQAQEASSSV